MQKYRQYCPVARASEILADRWTPLIVRELILGSHRFNEIERGLPGISRSLLASRLRDLEDAGIAIGEHVAAGIVALRANDGRNADPQYVQQPSSGPGVFEPDLTKPVLGLRLSRIRPLALESPWQLRPHGPTPLTSRQYAADFEEVKRLGRFDSPARTDAQTTGALFWTDHDLRQWNEGMLRLAADRGLDFVQTARMLALAHVSGADAMIACFDAKYHYMFWRPAAAIPMADTDSNPATEPDATWRPLRATPNFPEYPSAHACHSSAVVEALSAFFGTGEVHLSLASDGTGTTRTYNHLHDAVKDVEQARVSIGFHFRNSDLEGSILGRNVARFVLGHFSRPRDVRRKDRNLPEPIEGLAFGDGSPGWTTFATAWVRKPPVSAK